MSFWDYKLQKIITYPPRKSKRWPKWDEVDCGCSGGLQWGGEYPRECKTCGAKGFVFVHRKTATRAEWPGGPFC